MSGNASVDVMKMASIPKSFAVRKEANESKNTNSVPAADNHRAGLWPRAVTAHFTQRSPELDGPHCWRRMAGMHDIRAMHVCHQPRNRIRGKLPFYNRNKLHATESECSSIRPELHRQQRGRAECLLHCSDPAGFCGKSAVECGRPIPGTGGSSGPESEPAYAVSNNCASAEAYDRR